MKNEKAPRSQDSGLFACDGRRFAEGKALEPLHLNLYLIPIKTPPYTQIEYILLPALWFGIGLILV